MDKFELEQFSALGEMITELQTCFLEDDGYSRTPNAREWQTATRLVHRIKLAFCELNGYAKACRQYQAVMTRGNLQLISNEPELQGGDDVLSGRPDEDCKGFLIFTEKEILKMPKSKRNYFRIDGRKVRYRKRPNGVYELRKTINGVSFYGASSNLQQAKANFIKDLQERGKEESDMAPAPIERNVPAQAPCFEAYAYEYLDTFKRPNICKESYQIYTRLVKTKIAPYFQGKACSEITATDCQKLLTSLRNEGKKRTAESVKSLLDWICAACVTDGYLARNPMEQVQIPKHYRQNGQYIPLEKLTDVLTEPQNGFDALILLCLYSGIRPCEIASAVFEDGFMTVKNGKTRSTAPATFRRIPLHRALLPHLPLIIQHKNITPKNLSYYFHQKIEDYRLYDLRHTFTTRIQECGAEKSWVDYITNHVSVANVTSRIYTHWTDDFSRKQMDFLHF